MCFSGFCDLVQQLSIVASLGIVVFKRMLLGLISDEDCGFGEKEKKMKQEEEDEDEDEEEIGS